nr:MAG: internal scaffolding protein [Microvirus Sku15]
MDKKVLKMTSFAVHQPFEDATKDIVPSLGTTPSYRRLSDVFLLFNQERIDKLTQSQLIDYVRSNYSVDGLSEIRSKMSDGQICDGIKSRYIQSKSELKQYMDYLRYQSEDEKRRLDFDKKYKDNDKKDDDDDKKDDDDDKESLNT